MLIYLFLFDFKNISEDICDCTLYKTLAKWINLDKCNVILDECEPQYLHMKLLSHSKIEIIKEDIVNKQYNSIMLFQCNKAPKFHFKFTFGAWLDVVVRLGSQWPGMMKHICFRKQNRYSEVASMVKRQIYTREMGKSDVNRWTLKQTWGLLYLVAVDDVEAYSLVYKEALVDSLTMWFFYWLSTSHWSRACWNHVYCTLTTECSTVFSYLKYVPVFLNVLNIKDNIHCIQYSAVLLRAYLEWGLWGRHVFQQAHAWQSHVEAAIWTHGCCGSPWSWTPTHNPDSREL